MRQASLLFGCFNHGLKLYLKSQQDCLKKNLYMPYRNLERHPTLKAFKGYKKSFP